MKTLERQHLLKDQEEYVERAMSLSKGPFEILEDAEMSEMLQREIQELPRDQREVLLLSKYSGLSYEEIAQIVGSTQAAVKQKVCRALFSLREKFKELSE